MAAITGRWIFLVVMALAPILIAVDAVNRKKKTERKRQQRAEEFAAELAQFRAERRRLASRGALPPPPLGNVRGHRRRSGGGPPPAAVGARAERRRLHVRLRRLGSPLLDHPGRRSRERARRAPVGDAARDEPAGDRFPGHRRSAGAGAGGRTRTRDVARRDALADRVAHLGPDSGLHRRRVGVHPLAAAHVQRRPRLQHRHRRLGLGRRRQVDQATHRHPCRARRRAATAGAPRRHRRHRSAGARRARRHPGQRSAAWGRRADHRSPAGAGGRRCPTDRLRHRRPRRVPEPSPSADRKTSSCPRSRRTGPSRAPAGSPPFGRCATRNSPRSAAPSISSTCSRNSRRRCPASSWYGAGARCRRTRQSWSARRRTCRWSSTSCATGRTASSAGRRAPARPSS